MFIKRNIAVVRDDRFARVVSVGGDGNRRYGRRVFTERRFEIGRDIAFKGRSLVNAGRAAFDDNQAAHGRYSCWRLCRPTGSKASR
jgi:hypothetical protein